MRKLILMLPLAALLMSCGGKQKATDNENESKDSIVTVQDTVLVDSVEIATVSDSVII